MPGGFFIWSCRRKELAGKTKKTITTKDLAGNLGVDVKTIQRAVDSLDLNVERVGSSHTMIFNEAQATAVKKEVAKVLNVKGFGRNNIFELLRCRKILDNNNQPYQKYVDSGYFRVIESRYTLPTGEVKISLKTVVFQKGLDFIRKLIAQ